MVQFTKYGAAGHLFQQRRNCRARHSKQNYGEGTWRCPEVRRPVFACSAAHDWVLLFHLHLLAAEAEAVKVRVHFKAVAGAPILKKNKFLIPASEPFGTVSFAGLHLKGIPNCRSCCGCLLQVIKFLRAQLRLAEGASLVRACMFCFVLFCFIPYKTSPFGAFRAPVHIRRGVVIAKDRNKAAAVYAW
jgi:hypothetical protein